MLLRRLFRKPDNLIIFALAMMFTSIGMIIAAQCGQGHTTGARPVLALLGGFVMAWSLYLITWVQHHWETDIRRQKDGLAPLPRRSFLDEQILGMIVGGTIIAFASVAAFEMDIREKPFYVHRMHGPCDCKQPPTVIPPSKS
jgi:hypothetical protein